MGNGAKIALVALLIVAVVLVAKFVKSNADPSAVAEGQNPAASGEGQQAPATSRNERRRVVGQASGAPSGRARHLDPGRGSSAGGSGGATGSGRGSGTTPPTTVEERERQERERLARERREKQRRERERLARLERERQERERQERERQERERQERERALAVQGSTSGPGSASGTSGDPDVTPIGGTGAPGATGATGHEAPIETVATTEGGTSGGATSGGSSAADPGRGGSGSGTGTGSRGSGASSTPRPAVLDIARSTSLPRSHEVKSGESFWSIAETYYGDGLLCKHIQVANGNRSDKQLRAGETITIPKLPAGVRARTTSGSTTRLVSSNVGSRSRGSGSGGSAGSSGRATRSSTSTGGPGFVWHTVRSGETLSGIARRHLGSPQRYSEIEDLNPDLKWTVLRAGQRIKIPKR